jgi:hypothetical protein
VLDVLGEVEAAGHHEHAVEEQMGVHGLALFVLADDARRIDGEHVREYGAPTLPTSAFDVLVDDAAGFSFHLPTPTPGEDLGEDDDDHHGDEHDGEDVGAVGLGLHGGLLPERDPRGAVFDVDQR